MIPDTTPVLLIAKHGDNAYAFLRTKANIIDELDHFFSTGDTITTTTEPLEVNSKGASLLDYKAPQLFVLLICEGRDVTNELLSEAFERHNRLHNN